MKAKMEARRGSDHGIGDGTMLRRANPKAPWEERFAVLFEDLRKPARVLVNRTYASAISVDEIEDVYANAWTSTLKALGGRERHMPDHELRSYVLTAVANHASKEMRRRTRRPVAELEEIHAQSIADSHQPAPDELAVGSESQTVVRDLLTSLPPRRRAVMLLRYGWGMAPKEICTTIPGLSPRAYRKEVSKGVEELIERIGLHESGDWCRSREPLLRDYVAGVADEDAERQASQHLAHCHSCGELVGRLSSGLNDLGSGLAWTTVVGTVGEQKLPVLDRIDAGFDRLRDQATGLLDRSESATETAGTIAASGGTRGAGGAAGGGILAALGGGGAKIAAICGGTAAAGACVAAIAIPTIGPLGSDEREKPKLERRATQSAKTKPKVPKLTPTPSIDTYEPRSGAGDSGGGSHQAGSGGGSVAKAPESKAASGGSQPAQEARAEVAPVAAPPPVAAQTDPVAAASIPAPAAPGGGGSSGGSSGPAPAGGSGGGSSGARGSGGGEFGP